MDRRKLILASAAILVATFGAVIVLRGEGRGVDGVEGLSAQAPRGSMVRSGTEIVAAPATDTLREPVPEPPCRVLILSPDGAPVLQAAVRLGGDDSRWSLEEGRSALGWSAEDGSVVLEPRLCADGSRVEVLHPRFLRAFRKLSRAEPEPHVVTLEPAAEQELRARWTTGEPVRECSFWLSRSCLPKHLESAHPVRGTPSGPVERAIHGATVDERGVALVEGLAPGDYALAAAPPHLALVAVQDETGALLRGARIRVPTGPVTVDFAPLVVFALEPACDEAVAHRFLLGSDWSLRGEAAGRMESTREALELVHPGAAILVAVPRVPIHEAKLPTVELLLRRKGKLRLECEGVPLEHFAEPRRLECSALPDDPLIECELHVLDAAGNRLGPRDFILVEGDSLFDSFWHFPNAQGKVHLPPGEYRVHSTRPWLNGRFDPAGGSPPMHLEVRLKAQVRSCRLEYVLPWGEVAEQVHWKVLTPIGGGTLADFVQEGLAEAQPLPVGRLRIRAEVFGRPALETEVDVPPGAAGALHTIRVRG